MTTRYVLPFVSAAAVSLLAVPGIAAPAETVRTPILLAQAENQPEKDENGVMETIKDAADKARREASEAAEAVGDAVTGEDEENARESERREQAGERDRRQRRDREETRQRGESDDREGRRQQRGDDRGERARQDQAGEEDNEQRGERARQDQAGEQEDEQRGERTRQDQAGERRDAGNGEAEAETEAEAEAEAETREEVEAEAQAEMSAEEKARTEELAREREQHRQQRMERRDEARDGRDGRDDGRDRRGADERQAAPEPEIRELQPVQEETVRSEDGARVRVQSFRTDDGRRIEKRIRTEDDGDKVVVTRTQGRDGRTVERRRVIDHASDEEIEQRTVRFGEWDRDWRDGDDRDGRDGRRGDRDGRDRDDRRGDRDGRDRDWRGDDRRRGDWRDRDRDWRDRDRDVRIIIRAPRGMQIPLNRYVVGGYAPREVLYETLTAAPVQQVERRYSVQDVTQSERLRSMVRRVDLDTITFGFNEARIGDSQLGRLDQLAAVMLDIIERNPDALFLLEGHTDAVGAEVYNLELSEARALSVKYALMDAYGVPEDNLVTEGYGEEFLKVDTLDAERINRRVSVRSISDLVAQR